jgi:hypothetical protein
VGVTNYSESRIRAREKIVMLQVTTSRRKERTSGKRTVEKYGFDKFAQRATLMRELRGARSDALWRQRTEETEVTLAVSTPRQSESGMSLRGESQNHKDRSPRDEESARTATQVDVTMFARLLDEPAIAQWAAEAAVRFQVSALGALGLLAHALLIDAER